MKKFLFDDALRGALGIKGTDAVPLPTSHAAGKELQKVYPK
jgi:hypothetical protein